MKCGILVVINILIIVIGLNSCTERFEKKIVYNYFDKENNHLKKTDLVEIQDLDGSFHLSIKMNNKDTSIIYKDYEGKISILSGSNQWLVLYDCNNDSVYSINQFRNEYFDPMFVTSSRKIGSKIFRKNDQHLEIYKFFCGLNYSNELTYAYYTREIGFICFLDYNRGFYKIIDPDKIQGFQIDPSFLTIVLKNLIKDSTFFKFSTIIPAPHMDDTRR
jgi:hypothetical protein